MRLDLELEANNRTVEAEKDFDRLNSILRLSNERFDLWEALTPTCDLPKEPTVDTPRFPEKPYFSFKHTVDEYDTLEPNLEDRVFWADTQKKYRRYAFMIGFLVIVLYSAIGTFFEWDDFLIFGFVALLYTVMLYSFTYAWVNKLASFCLQKLAMMKGKEKWLKRHAEWKKEKESFEKKQQEEYSNHKAEMEAKYEKSIKEWEGTVEKLKSDWEQEKKQQLDEWKAKVKKLKLEHKKELRKLELFKENYSSGKVSAVEKYASLLLKYHHHDNNFKAQNTSQYLPDTKTLIVDCRMPAPEDLPTLKEVKYIKTKGSLKEIHFTKIVLNKLYDEVMYQLCLANINRIFLVDKANQINAIAFNGWVQSIDKSTGQEVKACILSLHVQKSVFQNINLDKVDPKECFKHLKGVGSSKLHGVTPIPPIMKINTEDSRFIPSYDVAHTLDEATNIAAMDWQDFEHLVREVFQKKLSAEGMEVKVTQSSRDKGVDAIAINPDPVSGGKIVIQAKRYTNVVGVAAVRELYGTVVNEGAMKGILVTTSNFGNDAYDFVKEKPLTLISGGELLSMLSQNGYSAKIDLKEAKELINKTA